MLYEIQGQDQFRSGVFVGVALPVPSLSAETVFQCGGHGVPTNLDATGSGAEAGFRQCVCYTELVVVFQFFGIPTFDIGIALFVIFLVPSVLCNVTRSPQDPPVLFNTSLTIRAQTTRYGYPALTRKSGCILTRLQPRPLVR